MPSATLTRTMSEDLACVQTFLHALVCGDAPRVARCCHEDCQAELPGEPVLADAAAIARYAARGAVQLLIAQAVRHLPPVVAAWGVCHRVDAGGTLRRERVTLLFVVARARIVHWQLRRVGEDRVARAADTGGSPAATARDRSAAGEIAVERRVQRLLER